MRPAGLILAGGRGRRFGGVDKAALRLGGQRLLERVAARLAPQVSRLAVSVGAHPECAAGTPFPTLEDTLPGGLGPLAGVLAGLHWAAAAGAEALVSAAVDTPFLPEDLVDRLLGAAPPGGSAPVIAASRDPDGRLRAHGTFALWPVALRGPLEAALTDGERRVMAWAEGQGAVAVEFPARDGMDPFFNINRPEDLVTAEAFLGRHASDA